MPKQVTKAELDELIAAGSEMKILPKVVTVDNIGEIAELLRRQADANQRAFQILAEHIATLNDTIADKKVPELDLSEINSTLQTLTTVIATVGNSRQVCDYDLDFERDPRTQLMKPGTVKFKAVPSKMN